MWNKFKQSEFCKKLKQASTNRTVYITAITLLVALAVLITVTAIANRHKKPPVNPNAGNQGVTDSGDNRNGNGDGNGTGTGTGDNTQSGDDHGGNQTGGKDGNGNGDGDGSGSGSQTTGALPTSFRLPADGSLSKGHDATMQVWSDTMGDWRVHLGVDINTAEGASVLAAADGTVEKVWEDPMMGLCVAIAHTGECRTVYKNLADELAEGIAEGVGVTAGQQIGCVGDSAILELAEEPHLHFEMTVNGLQVDPLEYFDAASIATLASDDSYEDLPVGEQDGPSGGTANSSGTTGTKPGNTPGQNAAK